MEDINARNKYRRFAGHGGGFLNIVAKEGHGLLNHVKINQQKIDSIVIASGQRRSSLLETVFILGKF